MTSKTSAVQYHPSSSNILRHISSPSLDFFQNHHTNSMSLNRSSFGRNHIRKKQPRTNPNYVNIQIKTDDGSLRTTYIRLNEPSKCQTLALLSSSSSSPSSSSSSSSNSASEQDSILDCSHSYSNESNGYVPSDETISTDRTHRIGQNQSINHQQASSVNSKQRAITRTLTDRALVQKKPSITHTDGRSSHLIIQ
jgi:hypothetical protein